MRVCTAAACEADGRTDASAGPENQTAGQIKLPLRSTCARGLKKENKTKQKKPITASLVLPLLPLYLLVHYKAINLEILNGFCFKGAPPPLVLIK